MKGFICWSALRSNARSRKFVRNFVPEMDLCWKIRGRKSLKVRFSAIVPEGYGDSGEFEQNVYFLADNLPYDKIRSLTKRAVLRMTDATFTGIVFVEETIAPEITEMDALSTMIFDENGNNVELR